MHNISIFLVDDHKLFREGLKLLLHSIPGIGKVYEANNGREFLEVLDEARPDVVLMDIDMPEINGIEATRRALIKYPDIKIVALSMYDEFDYYSTMINVGAVGFLLKNSGINDVENAIFSVYEGKSYFSQEIMHGLLRNITKRKTEYKNTDLTEREREILYHICKGLSNQEIANELFLSKRTIDKHRENLLFKTNSKNTASLVIYAIKNGIIEI